MSLDVYLTGAAPNSIGSGIFIREGGQSREVSRAEWDARYPGREPVVAPTEPELAYSGNITHNLSAMARAAGVYEPLWRPDEIGITRAAQLIEPLSAGLVKLLADPDTFQAHNPSNGWGTYEGLVAFVSDYLRACIANPNAEVSVWR